VLQEGYAAAAVGSGASAAAAAAGCRGGCWPDMMTRNGVSCCWPSSSSCAPSFRAVSGGARGGPGWLVTGCGSIVTGRLHGAGGCRGSIVVGGRPSLAAAEIRSVMMLPSGPTTAAAAAPGDTSTAALGIIITSVGRGTAAQEGCGAGPTGSSSGAASAVATAAPTATAAAGCRGGRCRSFLRSSGSCWGRRCSPPRCSLGPWACSSSGYRRVGCC